MEIKSSRGKFYKMVLLVFLTIALFYGTFYVFTGYKIGVFESNVKEYLIHQKKYSENDITSIKGVRSKGGDWGITIFVEFKDEPGEIYSYKSLEGKIKQDESKRENETRKHIDGTDDNHGVSAKLTGRSVESHVEYYRKMQMEV